MLSTCGSGLAPPNGMVKLSGFTWLKTFGPTTTHTGTVAVSPVVTNTNWPQKVPATSPPPGKLAGAIDTLTAVGAVPLAGERLSHLPPSAVVWDPVHFNVPVPAFLICKGDRKSTRLNSSHLGISYAVFC